MLDGAHRSPGHLVEVQAPIGGCGVGLIITSYMSFWVTSLLLAMDTAWGWMASIRQEEESGMCGAFKGGQHLGGGQVGGSDGVTFGI